jgi:hypothetical protein
MASNRLNASSKLNWETSEGEADASAGSLDCWEERGRASWGNGGGNSLEELFIGGGPFGNPGTFYPNEGMYLERLLAGIQGKSSQGVGPGKLVPPKAFSVGENGTIIPIQW